MVFVCEWMDEEEVDYFSTMRKKDMVPFVTTWMGFEDIMLGERSQTEKDKYGMFLIIGEN